MRTQSIMLFFVIVMTGLLSGVFSITLADGNSAEHNDHSIGFSVFTLIKVLGICALTGLLITFLTGLFRRRFGRKFLMVHRFFAWLTVILALSHGITVMVVF